jgi:hypothetical protein
VTTPVESGDAARCALCGRPWPEVDGGADWLHLEITRSYEGDVQFIDEDFCTREHAAEWLARPLPAPAEPTDPPTSWRDRVAVSLFALVLCLLGLLVVVGFVTSARFLLGLG